MKKNTENLYREEIIDKCDGCSRVFIQEGLFKFSLSSYCNAYLFPGAQWRFNRKCPLSTHLTRESEEKKKLNPLKQSKRSMGA